MPEGVPVDAMSMGGIDLDDPAYIGESSRDGNAAAVCVRVSGPSMLTADAPRRRSPSRRRRAAMPGRCR